MADGEATRGTKACPIQFDHESVEHARNWPAEFRELREQCPRAWTESYGGFWVATRFDDIVAIAQRPDVFSAHKDYDPVTRETKGGLTIPPVPGIRGGRFTRRANSSRQPNTSRAIASPRRSSPPIPFTFRHRSVVVSSATAFRTNPANSSCAHGSRSARRSRSVSFFHAGSRNRTSSKAYRI